jgi:hypothetical protein
MTVNINLGLLRRKIKPVAQNFLVKEARQKLGKITRDLNRELVKEFLSNPITVEIENGPNSDNLSQTLKGYGNLFSFIGFEANSDPIRPILDILSNSIKVSSIVRSPSEIAIEISVTLPTKEEIAAVSPLPWAEKSWVFAIESGLSGLGSYLQTDRGFESSRSGTGIQLNKKIRGGSFVRKKYMSAILKDVAKKLRNDVNSQLYSK